MRKGICCRQSGYYLCRHLLPTHSHNERKRQNPTVSLRCGGSTRCSQVSQSVTTRRYKSFELLRSCRERFVVTQAANCAKSSLRSIAYRTSEKAAYTIYIYTYYFTYCILTVIIYLLLLYEGFTPPGSTNHQESILACTRVRICYPRKHLQVHDLHSLYSIYIYFLNKWDPSYEAMRQAVLGPFNDGWNLAQKTIILYASTLWTDIFVPQIYFFLFLLKT